MKNLVLLALLYSAQTFAVELSCHSGNSPAFSVLVSEEKVTVNDGYVDGDMARETEDPDCVFRSKRFACYMDGQFMYNVPLTLLNGTSKKGSVYLNTDTGDIVTSQNHAALGESYQCVVKESAK